MRRLLAISFVALAVGPGCRMCASPYDYCGPVVDDNCCGGQYQGHAQSQFQSPNMMQSQGGMQSPGQFDSMPTAEMETTEPEYYESARPMPPKSATRMQNSRQFMATPSLPRQAKRPGSMRTY